MITVRKDRAMRSAWRSAPLRVFNADFSIRHGTRVLNMGKIRATVVIISEAVIIITGDNNNIRTDNMIIIIPRNEINRFRFRFTAISHLVPTRVRTNYRNRDG